MDVFKFYSEPDFPTPSIITPTIFKDERGYFFESYNKAAFDEMVQKTDFVQDNQSLSQYGTLRGFHFQKEPYAQAKLVRVVHGAVVDVAVDIRKDSPFFGKYYQVYLSDKNHRQFFIPRGFAHGFLALEDNTLFQYKCDNVYNKESEGGILYTDPDINFPWNEWINPKDIIISDKDKKHGFLTEIF